MRGKLVLFQPAHLAVIYTGNCFNSEKNTLPGQLWAVSDADTALNRFKNFVILVADSIIPADEIDNVVASLRKIATQLSFESDNWFETRIKLIMFQKYIPSKVLKDEFKLTPIHETVDLLLGAIDSKSDILFGTIIDKVTSITFFVAIVDFPEDHEMQVLAISQELLSFTASSEGIGDEPEVQTALDMLTIRMNQDGEDGTVVTNGAGQKFVSWSSSLRSDNDDVPQAAAIDASSKAGAGDQGQPTTQA